MPPGSISDFIIEQRSISGQAVIGPGDDDPVRAVDVFGRFAAIFRMMVDGHGWWYDDCSIALKTGDGWKERGGGGGTGEGMPTPWPPPDEEWKGPPLDIFGSAGLELPQDENGDDMVWVLGLYGFASPRIAAIRGSQGTKRRVIDVASPAGAFVVVITGTGLVELQGLDSRGLEVGRPVIQDVT